MLNRDKHTSEGSPMRRPQIGILLILSIVFTPQVGHSQQEYKTYEVSAGQMVILRDTSFVTEVDTLIRLPIGEQIRIKKDPVAKSRKFYNRLDSLSTKNKFTNRLYGLIVDTGDSSNQTEEDIVRSETPFLPYQGKIIRSVNFRKVPLLEGSVLDTAAVPGTVVGEFVNKMHMNTRNYVIRKNLLFTQGNQVDAFTFADNERILRQLRVLKDARIYLKADDSGDSVDVLVVTQDVASIGVSGNYYSLNNFIGNLFDVNMLGTATQFEVSYFYNANESKKHGYGLLLRDPNLFGSFGTGSIQYSDNYLRNQFLVEYSREFLTPRTKYGGGASYYVTRENFLPNEVDTLRLPYTAHNSDIWGGRSFQIDTRSNFVISGRLNKRIFSSRPYIAEDSNRYFTNRTLALISMALLERKYMRTHLIRGFGRTEDIPIGKFAILTTGREFSEFGDYTYYGLDLGYSMYLQRLGYFNNRISFSSFMGNNTWQDGFFQLGTSYFTPLIDLNKMRIRQFIDIDYTKGFRRVYDNIIKLAGKWETDSGLPPLGNERLTISGETVYFTTWYFYGFRFTFYHRFELNMLAYNTRLFSKQNYFPAIKAGIRTLNENLVFPTLSLNFAFYGNASGHPNKFAVTLNANFESLFPLNRSLKPVAHAFE